MSSVSSQKGGQRRDNVVLDTPDNLIGCFQRPVRQVRKLIHDYIVGQIVPHLHMRVRRRKGDPNSRDYCAIYQWPSEECLRSSDCSSWATQSAGAYRRLDDVKSAVLVDVTKFIKFPKGIKKVPLPTMIRLQALDDCLRTWVNGTDFPQATLPVRSTTAVTLPVQRGNLEDRELRGHENPSVTSLDDRQMVNQVVERSPRVIQEIPENQSDTWGWFQVYAEGSGDDDITTNLLLNLSLESIRVSVNVGGNFVFERLETLFRPVEFDGDVVNGFHEVHSHALGTGIDSDNSEDAARFG